MNHEDTKARSGKTRRIVFALGILLLAGVLLWIAAIPRGEAKLKLTYLGVTHRPNSRDWVYSFSITNCGNGNAIAYGGSPATNHSCFLYSSSSVEGVPLETHIRKLGPGMQDTINMINPYEVFFRWQMACDYQKDDLIARIDYWKNGTNRLMQTVGSFASRFVKGHPRDAKVSSDWIEPEKDR